MKQSTNNTILDFEFRPAEAGVIRTLLYFDIFQYPLTLDELVRFHSHKNTSEHIKHVIADLTGKSIVFRHGDLYSLRPVTSFIERRRAGNALARKKMKTAKRFSTLISKFPFIRAVMLSGSLSKDFMEQDSDIDYFIITEPGRLWLTRGMLALFKRMFLFNSHKCFCTNYLIDSDSLEIEEKNIYTAVELTTLIPVYGEALCAKFKSQNQWTKQYLPNMEMNRTASISEKNGIVKKACEKILSGAWGEKLDQYLMELAIKRWKKKFGNSFSPADFDLAFKSRRGVSKNHPRFFQKKILQQFQEKIEQFEALNKMKLSA